VFERLTLQAKCGRFRDHTNKISRNKLDHLSKRATSRQWCYYISAKIAIDLYIRSDTRITDDLRNCTYINDRTPGHEPYQVWAGWPGWRKAKIRGTNLIQKCFCKGQNGAFHESHLLKENNCRVSSRFRHLGQVIVRKDKGPENLKQPTRL